MDRVDLAAHLGPVPTVQLSERRSPYLGGSDYSQLSRRIRKLGLLEKQPLYYAVKILTTSGMWISSWGVLVWLRNSNLLSLVAVFFAFAAGQTAFLGHDAGHRQIFATRRANDIVGLISGNLLMGLSYGWWVDKHTRHHSNPNLLDVDPDISIGCFAFTQEQALEKKGLSRVMTRHQAFLFFPLLLLEALHMRLNGVRFLLSGGRRHALAESVLLLLHFGFYIPLLLMLLTPSRAIAFFAIHQGLMGLYLGAVFAPNHKGMAVFEMEHRPDFLRRQVQTTRNLRAPRAIAFAWGGVNFQIEHHLFPTMPRNKLRQAQSIVKAFCEQKEVSYCQDGVMASYAGILRYLHEVGVPLRKPKPAPQTDN